MIVNTSPNQGYQVDVWSGDCHQNHVSRSMFQSWLDAAEYMGEQLEVGHLCNVLHSDFKAPKHRVKETDKALAERFLE